MSTFRNFAIKQESERIAELGNRLGGVEKLIDWEEFRPIIRELYSNNTGKGGRPNLDEILISKCLSFSNGTATQILNLRGRQMIEYLSDSFLIFQIKFQIGLQSGHFVKEFQNRGRTV